MFDEATSALDSVSEEKVQTAMDARMKGTSATFLVIAHRISTIKSSDVIFVFKDGVIVEKGAYDELYGLNGEFYKLCQGVH